MQNSNTSFGKRPYYKGANNYNNNPGSSNFTSFDNPSTSSSFAETNMNPSTPEQHAFELEFKKWDDSFTKWKKTFEFNPDQSSFKMYERKFLEVRAKLEKRRAEIYKKDLNRKFDSHFEAAASMAESILSKFDETPNRGRSQDNCRDNYNVDRRFERSRSPLYQNNYQSMMQSYYDEFDQQWDRRRAQNINFPPMLHPNQRNHPNRSAFMNSRPPMDLNKKKGQPTIPETKKQTLKRIAENLATAKSVVFPRFPGAQCTKYNKLLLRSPDSYNEVEKNFMEYAKYVVAKRKEVFKRSNEERDNAKKMMKTASTDEASNTTKDTSENQLSSADSIQPMTDVTV